jgi:membrane-anchored protein YejM (alkaline phosphatase superfamily)
MCAMGPDGISDKYRTSPTFCFLMHNESVVQMPLVLENHTEAITNHATSFIRERSATDTPWFFFMSYFHVHTPLFTNKSNRGRSSGGEFGDNVEELDDSIGSILSALDDARVRNNTLIFLTSDNGPYQEEGWGSSGRTNLYDEKTGERIGRLRGGKLSGRAS